MKNAYLILISFATTFLFFSCSSNETDQINELSQVEIEYRDIQHEAPTPKKREWCVWEVSSVVGTDCKYSAGDKICYLCDEDGCSPGTIGLFKNFGDGCRTYGSWLEKDCKEREAGYCAGTYR